MVYPENPLDETWTDKGDWRKEPKPINLNHVGKEIPQGAIVYKPLRIRATGEIIDMATKRLNERTRLINLKADRIEKGLYDYLSQNEIERAYQKQLGDLAKLEAMFSNGVLGFLFDGVKTKATNRFRESFLQNDPDVVNFDRTSEQLAKATQAVAQQQNNNDNLLKEISTQTQEAENDLIQRLQIAETELETEELGDVIQDLDVLKKDISDIESLASFASTRRDEGPSYDDEQDILNIEADERQLSARLSEARANLTSIVERISGRALSKEIEQLKDNITTIQRFTQEGEPIRHSRMINNIIRDAQLGEVKAISTIKAQNKTLGSYIRELRSRTLGRVEEE